jgi:hypothetical protein
LLDVAQRSAAWDEVTIVADADEYPRANLSWHQGHGFVLQCFEDAESWGYLLAESPLFSALEVDIVLGGQVQERWPRELFVSPDLAREAPDFFLQTGTQKTTLHWVGMGAILRETMWKGREGREAWLKKLRE